MRRRLCLLACLPVPGRVLAGSPFDGLQPRGRGTLRYWGLRVYDIQLWAPPTALAAGWATLPLALEITYARTLRGADIAQRSLQEMRRQEAIAEPQARDWLAQMEAAFPDVHAGDRLAGRYRPGAGASFFFNGEPRREVQDAHFARLFFGIWLSPQTSEPGLRQALLARDAGS